MNKYKQIKTNIPLQDYDNLKLIAREHNLKLSGYLKHILLKNNLLNHITEKEKKKIKTIKKSSLTFKKVDSRLLYELNKIGVNLNQIAKKLNINKEVDFRVLEQIEQINNYFQAVKKSYL